MCTHVQRLTGCILRYRDWQDMYSCTGVDRIFTHVERLTGYVHSCTEIDRICTHVQRLTAMFPCIEVDRICNLKNVQSLTGYVVMYRGQQDMCSFQSLTGYVVMYRGLQDMCSCPEFDRICSYVQRFTRYVLMSKV